MPRRILLLGTVSITDDGRASALMRSSKGCALLCYLLARDLWQTREHLADLLWDAVGTAHSLRNMRVLLARIRPLMPGLQSTRRALRYQPQHDESVDYLTLSRSLSSRDNAPSLADLRLYRGELLEGLALADAPRFMEWLTLERERLRRVVLDAHQALCQSLASEQRWLDGDEAAAHWMSIDNLDEEALRWRLQFLAASSQFGPARRVFEAYRQTLWDELGIEPEDATLELIGKLSETDVRVPINVPSSLDPVEALRSAVLPDPGPLPANSIVPYHRNVDFVERESDLLRIASALGDEPTGGRPSAVAITGIGGLGKTQSAVEFCYRYGRYFTGGVFWLNFADAESVAEEVAAVGSERGLGLFRESDQLTLADRLGRVQRAWQEPVPRLLVLDNCEEERLLASWLPVSGGCRTLLTSRNAVWDSCLGVTVIALNVLDPEESVVMLRNVAAHVKDVEALEIAREVGHLPLALHLAGSFLRHYRNISPTSYVAQIRGQGLLRHPSLQGHGAGHSPTGHELSVERTYLLGWERLDTADKVDATARRLLAIAGCLAPGESIPADWLTSLVRAEQHDVMSSLTVEDGLVRLVSMGFLTAESPRTVVIHPLLARFTQQVVDERDLVDARDAIARAMAESLTECLGRDGHLSLLPMSAVHLRHTVDDMLERSSPLAATLATFLGTHLMNAGEYTPASDMLERACGAARESRDTHQQALALEVLARTKQSMGHAEDALRHSQQAVALLSRIEPPDPDALAQALYDQGHAYYWLGQADPALESAELGYRVSTSANIAPKTALCRSLTGVVNYYMLGNYELGRQQLEESLQIYREFGLRESESSVLNNLGENARLQGDYPLAVERYDAALAIAESIGNRNKADIIISNLCGARIGMGDYQIAASDLEGLIARTRDDWFGLSESYRFLAEAYLGLNRTGLALIMAQRSLALANETNLFERGRSWRVLGLVAGQLERPLQSDPDDWRLYDAATCFRRSLDYFLRGDMERDRALTLWRWAQYERTNGEQKRADAMIRKARDILASLNLPLLIGQMNAELSRGTPAVDTNVPASPPDD